MSKSIFVVCITLLVVLSPTLNAKMVTYPNGDRHCVMAQGQVISACLQQANGLPHADCCYAINDVNRYVETIYGRLALCKCFQEILKDSRFTKLIGMPEKCAIPNAVPFDPKTDCDRFVEHIWLKMF
ncbi:Non-specific lipid-transfer protein 15 [Arabidopsis thaliana]|uniref:Non-specific lipid-transfer protein 15 n=1 Tax=Arabidopsis thaliana TaxID=3702 RepID=NLTPF_ARATH|nr:non-specific lipid-transfer-like protein [Arabidopsis thaliana]Q9M0T1.1 RecName: Full=Non-specific lipid-transfer protein 15; Short=LTP 15; Flags: Precursor [Arabidopsis thaliana]AEE82654.2 non-specific lipid-transfer-like protein [Arabidopsis thaliana]CAB77978.1 putative lipid transfer protein [Arabidopsis thaliana]|eukprot:NP_192593.3 non-specific lipid-transfer-like protein [Arabidopsis thaliana]